MRVDKRLKTSDLRKFWNIGKISKLHENTVWRPLQKYIFGNTAQKLRRSRNQSFLVLPNFASWRTVIIFKYIIDEN